MWTMWITLEAHILPLMEEQGLLALFRQAELPLCPVLAEMEHTGFPVDRDALTRFGESLGEGIEVLQNSIYAQAGGAFNLNSILPYRPRTVLWHILRGAACIHEEKNLTGGMRRMSGILRSAGAVTLLSLLLRLASIFTQSRMAESLGAEGLGLLQLAMSVQALAVTLAMSGIRYSATRLIAQELGLGRGERVRRVTRACTLYALGFSLPAMAGSFLLAGPLARFAGDLRIAPALRLLSLGLPFLSLNGVLGGYFTAVGRPWKGTAVQRYVFTSARRAVSFSSRSSGAAYSMEA